MFSTHTNRTRFVLGQRWLDPTLTLALTSNLTLTLTLTLTRTLTLALNLTLALALVLALALTLTLTLTLGGSAPMHLGASSPDLRWTTYATTSARRLGCYTPYCIYICCYTPLLHLHLLLHPLLHLLLHPLTASAATPPYCICCYSAFLHRYTPLHSLTLPYTPLHCLAPHHPLSPHPTPQKPPPLTPLPPPPPPSLTPLYTPLRWASTSPSCTTTLDGSLTSHCLRSPPSPYR